MILVKGLLNVNLAVFAFCAIALGAAGQRVALPAGPNVKPPLIELDNPKVERTDKIDEKMFPDGVMHDFGKVLHGTQPKHTFRIVNTSTAPLRIVSVRTSMSPIIAYATKDVLQPSEEANLEITIDTRRFVGSKTMVLFVSTDNGRPLVTRFIFKADSQERLEPAEKIDPMFPDGLAHDFGKVQRGTQAHHSFRIVNTSNVPLQIKSLRASMTRSLTVQANKSVLQPNEEAKIDVIVDTRQFIGAKTQKAFLILDNGKLKEHGLWVNVVSCENLAFFPNSLDFGRVKRGETPTAHMVVTVPDQPQLKITAVTCRDKFIKAEVKELDRGRIRALYQVSATVRDDIPAGELRTEVELTTNNPAMPKLLIPLGVVVETPK